MSYPPTGPGVVIMYKTSGLYQIQILLALRPNTLHRACIQRVSSIDCVLLKRLPLLQEPRRWCTHTVAGHLCAVAVIHRLDFWRWLSDPESPVEPAAISGSSLLLWEGTSAGSTQAPSLMMPQIRSRGGVLHEVYNDTYDQSITQHS